MAPTIDEVWLEQTRRHRSESRERISATPLVRDRWALILILVVWAWSVVPRLIQTLTAPKYRVRIGEAGIPDTAIAALSETALTLLLFAVCGICVLRALDPGRRASLAGLLVPLAPWMYVVVRDLFDGDKPRMLAFVYPAVVGALWSLRPSMQLLRYVGLLTGLAAVLSLLLGALLPEKGVFRLSSGETVLQDKAVLPWGILVGFLNQGNNLGVLLVLGVPFVAMLPRWRSRLPLLAACLLALLWTASRGSLAALAALTVAAGILALVPRDWRKGVGVLMALSPLALAGVLPLRVTDPLAFTNRGMIWITSRSWWGENLWFGRSSNWYHEVASTTERISSSAFHGHNQPMHLGVTGGVLLLILTAAFLVMAAVRAADWSASGDISGVVYLVALGTTMVLERPLSFVDNLNLFPVVIVPLIFLVAGDRRPAELRSPRPTSLPGVLGDAESPKTLQHSYRRGDVDLRPGAVRGAAL